MEIITPQRKLIIELAEQHALYAVVDSMKKSRKPGEIVQALSPEKREILKGLTSADMENIRVWWMEQQ